MDVVAGLLDAFDDACGCDLMAIGCCHLFAGKGTKRG